LTLAGQSFSTTEARHGFSLGPENQELASLLLFPAPSTFSAAIRARFAHCSKSCGGASAVEKL
jgi:hypothetical protein